MKDMRGKDATIGIREKHNPGAPTPLAVITIAYNSADVLPGLLSSLEAGLAGIPKREIIVVDNNSRDNSIALASAHPARPHVIPTGRNGGYSAGINAATAAIPPEWNILILNADLRLFPGAAKLMADRLSDPRVGIVVPQILNEDGSRSLSLRREPSLTTVWSEALLGGRLSGLLKTGEVVADLRHYEKPRQVEWATGAALMVSAQARAMVGNWDENFFLYSEEVDYMRRARAAGFTVEYEPGARVMHIGGDTKASPFLYSVQTTSRLRDYNSRNGAAARALFRAGVVAGEAIRSIRGKSHRAALRAALSPVRPIIVP